MGQTLLLTYSMGTHLESLSAVSLLTSILQLFSSMLLDNRTKGLFAVTTRLGRSLGVAENP